MAKKINYASMFTLRADGRYQGYWHDKTGKRHTICDRNPETLYHKIELKESTQPDTFETIAEKWFEEHAEQVSYKTAESYNAPLRRINARFGSESILSITAAEISAFLSALAKQDYSRRSVQLHRDILNMICNYAIMQGACTYNPCTAVALPHGLRSTKRELPTDPAIAAIKEHTDDPFALFALICLYSGLRRGEVLALRYEDIDREAKVIHVKKAVEFVGNKPEIKEPKTEAGKRDVILLDVLAQYIPDGSGYIFDMDGHPLTKTAYRKRWLKYCRGIGYDITAHQLRHGYTTMLFEAGISDKDAQELLGHSNITVTRNIYTHIRQSHREETAAKLNDFLR